MKTTFFIKNLAFIFLLIHLFSACQEQKSTNTSDTVRYKKREIPSIVEEKKISPIEEQMLKQGLINIRDLDSSIFVELKYSTNDNFVGTDVYGDLTNAYLQRMPAEKLLKASQLLKEKYPNYRLLVYDAARPLSIQKIFWNLLDSIPPARRKDYVSDPKEYSIHNFGSAVDLTIFNLERNQVLDMGTKYDYFGDLAYPKLESVLLKKGKLSKTQIENREVLRQVMQQAGFSKIESEWWHFNAISRQQAKEVYPVIQ